MRPPVVFALGESRGQNLSEFGRDIYYLLYIRPLTPTGGALKIEVNMCLFPQHITTVYGEDKVVKCNICIECTLQDTREWAIRIMLELKEHEESCCVTLTYNEENCPGELCKRDYQLFLKSLRKALAPRKIRYFCSGEYGSKGGRPHYHIIIFGWCPSDGYFWKKGKAGSDQYRSPFLEKIWRKGFSTYGKVTYNTAYYTSKYLQKVAWSGDDTRQPPFVAMSTHPGIGANAFNIEMLADDKVYCAGRSIRLPRYFEKLAVNQGYSLDALRTFREEERVFRVFDKKKLRARRLYYLHKFGILKKKY